MRTSASFAALVTLMAVAGTSAAPIEVNPGSAARVVANALPHQRSRSVVPVSGVKLPDHDMGNPVNTPRGKCGECDGDGTTISIEGVQPLKNDAGNLAKDLPGKVQVPVDNGMTPLGNGVHIDTSLAKLSLDHGNGSPDKAQVPDMVHVDANVGDSKPQPDSSSQPPNHSQGQPDDCPDPSKDHHDEGLEVAATVGAPVEGGKKDLDKDAAHLVGSTTDKLDGSGKKVEDTIKAGAKLALDDAHKVEDKAEDKAHDVGKDVHLAAEVDVGSADDALKSVGGPSKPKLSAVQEVVEGADHLAKDLDQSAITLGQGHKNEKPEDCEDGVTVGSQHGNPSVSTPVVRLSGSRV